MGKRKRPPAPEPERVATPLPEGAPVPLWTVSGVMDVAVFIEGQGYVRGKRVAVTLFDSQTFTREYPLSGFNPLAVQKDIEEHVKTLMHVLTLEGPHFFPGSSPPSGTP